jgi:hypothetical protein
LTQVALQNQSANSVISCLQMLRCQKFDAFLRIGERVRLLALLGLGQTVVLVNVAVVCQVSPIPLEEEDKSRRGETKVKKKKKRT